RIEPPQVPQRGAQVVVRFGNIWGDLEGPAQLPFGEIVLALLEVGRAQHMGGIEMGGFHLEYGAVLADGLVEFAPAMQFEGPRECHARTTTSRRTVANSSERDACRNKEFCEADPGETHLRERRGGPRQEW